MQQPVMQQPRQPVRYHVLPPPLPPQQQRLVRPFPHFVDGNNLQDEELEAQISTYHRDKIWSLINARRYVDAAAYARNVISTDCIKGNIDSFHAHAGLSVALIQQEKFAEAKEACTTLFHFVWADIDNKLLEDCYYRMAFCHLELGELEEAHKYAKCTVICWRKRGDGAKQDRSSIDLMARVCTAMGNDNEAAAYLSLLTPRNNNEDEGSSEIEDDDEEPSLIEEDQEPSLIEEQNTQQEASNDAASNDAASNDVASDDVASDDVASNYDNERDGSQSPTPARREASHGPGSESEANDAEESVQIFKDAPGFTRVNGKESSYNEGSRRDYDEEDQGSRGRNVGRAPSYSRQPRDDPKNSSRQSPDDSRGYPEGSPSRPRRSSSVRTFERLHLPVARPPRFSEKPEIRNDRRLGNAPVKKNFDHTLQMPGRYPTPDPVRLVSKPLKNVDERLQQEIMYYISKGDANRLDDLLKSKSFLLTTLLTLLSLSFFFVNIRF